MEYVIKSREGTNLQQVCRWAIIVVFASMFVRNAVVWYGFYAKDFELFASAQSSYLTMIMLAVEFLAFLVLSFITGNKSVKVGSWLMAATNFAGFFTLLPHLLPDIAPYPAAIVILLDGIQELLFFSGVVMFCSDKQLLDKVPRLSLIYIFLLGILVVYLPCANIFSKLWPLMEDFYTSPIGIIDLSVWFVRIIIGLLFWFYILKPATPSESAAECNPLKQPAIVAIACMYVVFYFINLMI